VNECADHADGEDCGVDVSDECGEAFHLSENPKANGPINWPERAGGKGNQDIQEPARALFVRPVKQQAVYESGYSPNPKPVGDPAT